MTEDNPRKKRKPAFHENMRVEYLMSVSDAAAAAEESTARFRKRLYDGEIKCYKMRTKQNEVEFSDDARLPGNGSIWLTRSDVQEFLRKKWDMDGRYRLRSGENAQSANPQPRDN